MQHDSVISMGWAQVIYDPNEVEYGGLLHTFFEHVDPTTKDRQGGDVGSQYRSAIYYHSPAQHAAAVKACMLMPALSGMLDWLWAGNCTHAQ